MRYIRTIFWAIVAIILVIVALANRDLVTLHVSPDDIAAFLPIENSFDVPLFVVILASVVAGLLIGFVWEYIREFRQRAEAAKTRRALVRLEREVSTLRAKAGEGQDDVLALLD